MTEKPKHVMSGMNPFDYAKAENKGKLEKQNLATLKNKLHKTAPKDMKQMNLQVLDKKAPSAPESMKLREDGERKDLRKREHKSLMKSLTLAQKSTASMGQFDKRLKTEPKPAASQTVHKKKSNKGLFELESNRKGERSRNVKILDIMQRKREIELGGKVNGNLAGAKKVLTYSSGKKKNKKTGKKN